MVIFRKGPGRICRIENLSEFRELAWIWESSLWQSHSRRAPSVGPSPIELWRTPVGRRPNAQLICRISGWPRAVNAISSAGHLRAPAEFLFHGITQDYNSCPPSKVSCPQKNGSRFFFSFLKLTAVPHEGNPTRTPPK